MMTSSTSAAARVGKLSGLRVLIAEDSWIHADTLSVILESEGAIVVGPCSTAADAIEHVGREPIDFALLDMNLGGVFADDLASTLSRHTIPYAIVTAYRSLPSNADAEAVGVLRKPINAKSILDLLSRWSNERSR